MSLRLSLRLAAGSAAVCVAALTAGCIHPAMPSFSPDRPRGGRLMEDVRALSSDEMAGRMIDTKGSIRARAYILNRFKQEGVRPLPGGWLQTFNFTTKEKPGEQVRGTNVLGWVRGRTHPDQVIVVSAHYDHLGVENGKIYNGADDNASGVAGILDLAHQMRGRAPNYSVIFAAFDGEEEGLKGAQAFVANPPIPMGRIVFNLNLDMISRIDKGELYAVGTYQYPQLRNPLEQVAQGSKVRLLFGRDTPTDTGSNHWVELSDQEPFYKAGVPFIFFSVDDHADYHEPTDDAERIPIPFYEAGVKLIGDVFRMVDTMDLAALKAEGHR